PGEPGPGPTPSPGGPGAAPEPGGKQPGPPTKEAAKLDYEREAAANDACGRSDPAFLGRLTTLNVARDLDRVRSALGERTWSFFGVSWGTRLGVAYRGAFPGKVHRMFLDSVVRPRFNVADAAVDTASAAERDFLRLAAWIARRHDAYGFGTSKKKVYAAILKLREKHDAKPKKFTDLGMPVDGSVVARLASQHSPEWPQVAQAFKELRDATGSTAPPALKKLLDRAPTRMVPGAPEIQNTTMRLAVACNEDSSRLGFPAAWAAYRRHLEKNPVTGRARRFSVECAGWPLPVQKMPERRTGGSLVLSGHLYEHGTPYQWTPQMRSAIGGKVFTVRDDVHGSAMKDSSCAGEVVAYFTTGRIDRGCEGLGAAS
ncbi:alpha/beta hydrolase, partial [Nonomuraea mesophila]